MAKLDRKDVKIFAENSKETLITEFRTEDSEGSTASFSRDPDVIQNENYSQGWVNDTNNFNTKIYGEDLNAVNYVLSYLLKYLYENGIAEWKNTTTYYQNSICKVDNALYLSLQNNNIGNDPTSTVSYWKLIPLENVSIEDAGSGFSIVKDVTDNVITFKTISVTGYGEITDNGDQLNIDIAGGGGGGSGDAYWGTIRGTITNQTDLIALINLKQDIFTVDSPLVLTDEQHLTINKATSSVSGYLDYNDFNTFNSKQDTISATLPISITNNNIEIETADTSTTGVLSYTDWNTFNNKQDEIQGFDFYYTEGTTTDRARIVPNTSVSDIGSNSNKITNLYVSNINSSNDTGVSCYFNYVYGDYVYGNSSVRSDLFLPLVSSSTAVIGSSSSAFSKGYINDVYVSTINGTATSPNNITISSNLNPDSTDNNRKLGSSSNKFYEGWITYLKTNQISGTGNTGTKLDVGYNHMSPNNDNVFVLGYQNAYKEVYSYNFHQASDINKKKDIKDYNENILDKIDSLTPITYKYENDKENKEHLGLSAQELKEIEPLIVSTQIKETKSGKEEELGIDLYSLSVFAIKAIKELNAKVEALEARIEELEGNKEEELRK